MVNAGGTLHVFLRTDDDRWVETAKLVPSGGESRAGVRHRQPAGDYHRRDVHFRLCVVQLARSVSGQPRELERLTTLRWSLSYDTDVRYSIRTRITPTSPAAGSASMRWSTIDPMVTFISRRRPGARMISLTIRLPTTM